MLMRLRQCGMVCMAMLHSELTPLPEALCPCAATRPIIRNIQFRPTAPTCLVRPWRSRCAMLPALLLLPGSKHTKMVQRCAALRRHIPSVLAVCPDLIDSL